MNVSDLWPIVSLLLGLAAASTAMWAMAERAAGRQARLELRLLTERSTIDADILKAQTAASANAVAEELVKRAGETFAAQDRLAQAKLEAQLKPVADSLEKFQAHVIAVEKTRAEETGGLKAQIEQLLAASTATQEEARKLSLALRRGAGVQGRWGEQMLTNVLEMAGLKLGTDFQVQSSVDTGEGILRPDVVVRLPRGGVFVIDAKCSLNAFMDAHEATDELTREAGYKRHAQSVRGHIESLANKAYWSQFEAAPDFVVMFVPGETFLAAAAEREPELFTRAMERRVILVTPTSLFALCKAVVYGWRVEEQNTNAKQIAMLGRDLYKRLSVMGGHVSKVGDALTSAAKHYNALVGSLETQVLSQARKFQDLKVDNQAVTLTEPQGVEVGIRPLGKLAPALTLVEAAPTSAP